MCLPFTRGTAVVRRLRLSALTPSKFLRPMFNKCVIKKMSAIKVCQSQKANPLLTHISSVQYQFADIVPDYIMGASTCALFLSLKYHKLYPDYIYERTKMVGPGNFELRILLLYIDTSDYQGALKELTKVSFISNWTIVLVWSFQEAAKYLENFKILENKPPDRIKEKKKEDFIDQAVHFLTRIPSINSTDALSLLMQFGSIQGVVNASKEDLQTIPGLGPKKIKRLLDAFSGSILEIETD